MTDNPITDKTITEAERVRLERAYDNIHNEGYDGYNPYRQGDSRTYTRRYVRMSARGDHLTPDY